jgi:hypothetical protein
MNRLIFISLAIAAAAAVGPANAEATPKFDLLAAAPVTANGLSDQKSERINPALASLKPSSDGLFVARGGLVSVRYNSDILRTLKITEGSEAMPANRFAINELRFAAPSGNFADFAGGNLPSYAMNLSINGKLLQRWLTATPKLDVDQARIYYQWQDQSGAVWFVSSHAHSLLVLNTTPHLQLNSAEFLIGSALAQQLNDAKLDGQIIGIQDIQMPVIEGPQTLASNSCEAPVWPSATLKADVRLIETNGIQQMRCDGCDGPGNNDATLVVAPNAVLRNVGPTDVPWYQKFTGIFPPYLNDQHPYLVWGMYRQDSDGVLRQIGRSGVKHAYFAQNTGCSCDSQGRILGRNCSDAYSAGTNDTPGSVACTNDFCFQGKREEILPAEGLFFRCGSNFDPNCDGDQSDQVQYGPYENRMLINESELTGIPGNIDTGNRWFLDAWYLVRDESTWLDNIGTRQVAPTYSSGIWLFNQNLGPFQQGTVLDRWDADLPNLAGHQLSIVETPLGKVQVSVRVRRIPGDRWEYQNTVFNADFMTAEYAVESFWPRLISQSSFSQIGFRSENFGAQHTASRMVDLDRNTANDWTRTSSGNTVRFTAPLGSSQPWGSVYTYIYTATAPPGGNTTIEFRVPAGFVHEGTVLGPNPDVMLSSGFE